MIKGFIDYLDFKVYWTLNAPIIINYFWLTE